MASLNIGNTGYIDGSRMVTKEEYAELYKELELLEDNGIYLTLEGTPVSAFQVVQAHMLKESGTYMRDYILDSDGHLQVLIFNDIQQNISHV